MKKYLLIGLTCLLAACTPTVSTVARTAAQLAGPAIELGQKDAATFARDGKDLLLTNRGTDDITGDPSRPGDRAVVTVVGSADLVVTGNGGSGQEACVKSTRPGYWTCYRLLIPLGFAFRIVVTAGSVQSADALYYRASSGAALLIKTLH